MEEEEHEVYGGEIPDMEGDMEPHNTDVDMSAADEDAVKELDEMKKRLKEMGRKQRLFARCKLRLRKRWALFKKVMNSIKKRYCINATRGIALEVALEVFSFCLFGNLNSHYYYYYYYYYYTAMSFTDPASAAANQANREEADSRSVFVGNVDYACTPEEVQQHFQSCGTVNRVTILTDKYGQPKGFAYVEFLEVEAVQEALLLNESELHGRQLKVLPKRTNVPGMKQYRPRRFNPYMGHRFRRPYVPPYFYSPYGYGKVPRFRRPMRYMPYY
ncbi:hypothetical protein GH714_017835 [Hevea brasiliensis]|uniref:RRM domain-containing protein n=1 Tax=Hevea brasiliensis TaxID=3981 RepID=A0A6A6K5C4_HEVBR|nr:hypothetical protein GH714_017835 [Hevea brasiliensis]